MDDDLKAKFDGIYHRTMPLVLFSYNEQKKNLLDLLRTLFSALMTNDIDIFNATYCKLDDNINNREHLDSNREFLMKQFNDMYKSLEEKINEHGKVINELRPLISQISRNQNNISNHNMRIKELIKQIKASKKDMPSQKIIKQKFNAWTTEEVEALVKTAPRGIDACDKHPALANRTKQSITAYAQKHDIKIQLTKHRWTEAEDKIIKEIIETNPHNTLDACIKHPALANRTKSAIKHRIFVLNKEKI